VRSSEGRNGRETVDNDPHSRHRLCNVWCIQSRQTGQETKFSWNCRQLSVLQIPWPHSKAEEHLCKASAHDHVSDGGRLTTSSVQRASRTQGAVQ